MNTKIFNKNRIKAYFVGLIGTLLGWYSIILMTQTKVELIQRHYIALCIAIIAYTLWWFKFCYLIKSN